MPAKIDDVITQVRERHLTYLTEPILRDLADAVAAVEELALPGALVETGTALGGSAIVMACAKAPDRDMKAYDAFGMIPPPTDEDGEDVRRRYEKIRRGESKGIGGDTYYGYREDLLAEVRDAFTDFGLAPEASNVELIKGYFEDTLKVDYPVALAHLDGDWYESTMVCLERIEPNLVPGGRLIIDDYDFWAGCRKAVDEYFEGRDGFQLERRNRLHVVKM